MEGWAPFAGGFAAFAAALVLVATCPPARAQQPTAEQTNAIRANCRSDFMANCSGVQPGGRDALECLQRNMTRLSGGCKAAVSAISPPAAAPPAAATAPAPRSAPAASVPTAPVAAAPASPPMTKPPAKPAPAAKTVARSPAASPPAPPPVAAAPAVPSVPPLVLRPMLPARRAMITGICRGDAERLCAGQPPVGPAVLDCLAVKAASLSPTCYEALARVSRP